MSSQISNAGSFARAWYGNVHCGVEMVDAALHTAARYASIEEETAVSEIASDSPSTGSSRAANGASISAGGAAAPSAPVSHRSHQRILPPGPEGVPLAGNLFQFRA